MADVCGASCDLAQATFTYSPISGNAPMYDEGDIVSYEVEETEFNEHTDHTGDLLISSFKGSTRVDITLNLFPCSDWYRELYNAWVCNKGICGDIVVNDPCCDVRVFTKGRIKKMGIKPVSYDAPATEILFTAYIPSCTA